MTQAAFVRCVIIGAAWLWGFWALAELTDAGSDLFVLPLLVFFAGAIGLAWAGYWAAFPNEFRGRRERRLFWSVPATGVCALALGLTDYDLMVRVWLCEPALRERAEAHRQALKPGERLPAESIGLFGVQAVSAEEDQVAFQTAEGFMTATGLVYRPDGARPVFQHRLGSCEYEHLFGPWWRFYEIGD